MLPLPAPPFFLSALQLVSPTVLSPPGSSGKAAAKRRGEGERQAGRPQFWLHWAPTCSPTQLCPAGLLLRAWMDLSWDWCLFSANHILPPPSLPTEPSVPSHPRRAPPPARTHLQFLHHLFAKGADLGGATEAQSPWALVSAAHPIEGPSCAPWLFFGEGEAQISLWQGKGKRNGAVSGLRRKTTLLHLRCCVGPLFGDRCSSKIEGGGGDPALGNNSIGHPKDG